MKERQRLAGIHGNPASMARAQSSLQRLLHGAILGIFLLTTIIGVAPLPVQQAEARFLETKYTPGELRTPRQGFTAHLIKQGLFKGNVLVVGGFDGVSYLSSVERYDPVSGNFYPFDANLSAPRAYHAAVELSDGRVAFIGGRTADGTLSKTIEIFDPQAGTINNMNSGFPLPSLTTAREFHTATYFTDTIGNEKVLIAGGSDGTNPLASTEVLDLGNNTVTAGPVLATPRAKQAAYLFPAVSSEGQILLFGGTTSLTDTPAPIALTATERYDIASNTISSAGLSGASGQITEPRVGFSHSNIDITPEQRTPRILVAGGQRALTQVSNTAVVIEWNGSAFVANVPAGSGKTFTAGRRGATAVIASEDAIGGNKKVYFIGGESAANLALYSIETYDIATNSFSAATGDKLGTARAYATAVQLPRLEADGARSNNEQILLLGGESQNQPIIQAPELLDTQRYQVTANDMVFPRADFEAILITDNQPDGSHYVNYGKYLILGGRSNAASDWMANPVPRFEVEIYDPVTNTFSDLCTNGRHPSTNRCLNANKDLKAARYGLTATTLADGRIIITGGVRSGADASTVEVFNPQTSSFSTLSTSGQTFEPRTWHTATPINDNEILIFGGTTGRHSFVYPPACTPGLAWGTPQTMSVYLPMAVPQVLNTQTGVISSTINGKAIGFISPRFGHVAVKNGDTVTFVGGTLFGQSTVEGAVDRLDLETGNVTTPAQNVLYNMFRVTGLQFEQNGTPKLLVTGGISQVAGRQSGTTAGSCSGTVPYVFGSVTDVTPARYSSRNTTTTIVDLSDGSVTTGPNFPVGLEFSQQVMLHNGHILVTGTNSTTANRVLYDLDLEGATINPLLGLTRAIHNGGRMFRITPESGTPINTGKVVMAGGYASTAAVHGSADVYDPANMIPNQPGDPVAPTLNQVYSNTRQPVLAFSTTDMEEDALMYQIQIVSQTSVFPAPANALDPSNPTANVYNFIQRYDPAGFIDQDVENLYASGSIAKFDMGLTDFALPNGSYKMRVRAIDPLGSKQYSTWGPLAGQINFTINAESVAPETTITQPARTGPLPMEGIAPITGTASDATGIRKVRVAVRDTTTNRYWNGVNGFTMNNEVYFDATGTMDWAYSSVVGWVDGHGYEVKAKAVDTTGNVDATPATRSFTYDADASLGPVIETPGNPLDPLQNGPELGDDFGGTVIKVTISNGRNINYVAENMPRNPYVLLGRVLENGTNTVPGKEGKLGKIPIGTYSMTVENDIGQKKVFNPFIVKPYYIDPAADLNGDGFGGGLKDHKLLKRGETAGVYSTPQLQTLLASLKTIVVQNMETNMHQFVLR